MDKSAYRKATFIIRSVSLFLLIAIAWKVELFQAIAAIPFFPLVRRLIQNSWVCSICSSLIAVFLIYKWQIWYSKRKLKADFRCNEVIEDVYDGVEEFEKIYVDIVLKRTVEDDKSNFNERKKKAQTYIDFYKKNAASIGVANLSMSYEGVDLLLDSIQSCFFINLNFELLSIMNNIKNRLPNLRKKYPEIIEKYRCFEETPNDEELLRLGNMLHFYFVDLKLIGEYWKALFDYLEYDYAYVKLFSETYNQKYSLEEDMKQPVETINAHIKEVEKITKQKLRKDRRSHIRES